MNLKKYRVAIVIQLCAILLLASGIVIVLAQTGTTFTISEGIYPGAPSDTFWNLAGTYYAKNAYGSIGSSTNISYLVNNVIDGFNTGDGSGHTLQFKSGIYTFTAPIRVTKQVGEIWDTSISFEGESDQYGTIFRKNFNGDLFQFGDGIDRIGYLTLRNLYLDGRNNTGHLIHANTVNALSLFNSRLEFNDGSAVYLNSTWGGGCQWLNSHVQYSGNATEAAINIHADTNAIEFYNVGFSVNNGIAVNISSAASSIGFYKSISESLAASTLPLIADYGLGTRIIGCSLSVMTAGNNLIELRGIRTIVEGNVITSSTLSGRGIYVASSFSGNIEGNHIYDCDIGVYVDDGYPNIEGNTFWDNTNAVHVENALVSINNNECYYNKEEAIHIYLGYYSIINDNMIVIAGHGSGAASFSGIVLNATNYVNVQGNMVHDWQGVPSTKYGIEEVNGANFSAIIGDTCVTPGTYGIHTIGANTHVNLCWNGTTWIP